MSAEQEPDKLDELIYRLNAAIVESSDPNAAVVDDEGRMHGVISYDTATVLEALASVASSVAVQSGEFATPKARREVADWMRKVFLSHYGHYEKALKQAMDAYIAGKTRQ